MSDQSVAAREPVTQLICLGLSHQTAPLALRELPQLAPDRLEPLQSSLIGSAGIEEAVILATCNRVEFYLSAPDAEEARLALLAALTEGACPHGIAAVSGALYLHTGDVAAEHLFRVAAGIESLIIGEAQILGQVRKAFDTARALGTCGEFLSPLFQRTIAFGRRVRTETAIGRGNVSVASVACRVALEQLGTMEGRELLIVGSGATAQLAGRHFAKENPARIRVLNRTYENARAMAKELGGEAVPIDQLQTALRTADVVLCAVGAPHHIITREGMMRTMQQRNWHPVILIDLAVPRNVDPRAEDVPGVKVRAIEHLEAVAAGNRANREAEILHVERLVRRETRSYRAWAASSSQSKLLTTLRRRTAAIQKRAFGRHLRHEEEETRQRVERLSATLLRAVLHDVTAYIRGLEPDSEEALREMETIRRAFALDDSPPEEDAISPATEQRAAQS